MSSKLKFCIGAVSLAYIGIFVLAMFPAIGDYIYVMRHGSNGGGIFAFFITFVIPPLTFFLLLLGVSILGIRKNRKWAWIIFYGYIIVIITSSLILVVTSFFWSSDLPSGIISSVALIFYSVIFVTFSSEMKKAKANRQIS